MKALEIYSGMVFSMQLERMINAKPENKAKWVTFYKTSQSKVILKSEFANLYLIVPVGQRVYKHSNLSNINPTERGEVSIFYRFYWSLIPCKKIKIIPDYVIKLM